MRIAAAFLPLLLCLYWTRAQGKSGGGPGDGVTHTEVESEILGVKATSDQTNITPDIWAELKELRDMAIEHSVELRNSKSKIEKLEQENADIQARLAAREIKNAALEARTNANEKEVEELKRENADRPKVAFSLGLTDAGQVGPFNTDITLKFSRVLANFGQAYSPTTGIFTAPVRGAYYFRFRLLSNRVAWTEVQLYHNGKIVIHNGNFNDGYGNIVNTNALVLQLEKEDVVYLVLPANFAVYDDGHNHSTFSGFLLFPL